MQFTRWKRKSHRGFSLIELMVTLCIMLLLGGFTLHGLIDQKHRHDMDGLQENFIDLSYTVLAAQPSFRVARSSYVRCAPNAARCLRGQLAASAINGSWACWHLPISTVTGAWMTTNTLSLSCQASTPPLFAGALFVTALICDLPLKV